MNIQVRACQPDEQVKALEVCETAFSEGFNDKDAAAFKKLLEPERTFGAFDGESMVGAGASYPFEMSIPGAFVPTAGVSFIGVLPSHRRRGVLRAMMSALHDHALSQGEPVAALWASETGIYQRFGYGLGDRAIAIKAQREHIEYLDHREPVGSVRMVPLDEAPGPLSDVYERVRAVTPGMMDRTDVWWRQHTLLDLEHRRDGSGPTFCAVLEIDGRPEGYALYNVKGNWEKWLPAGTLSVQEAVATSPTAIREIWRFIFGVDLIETVSAWIPTDHPLPLLVTESRRLGMSLMDALWVRLLDLPVAMAARTYAASDRLVLEVSDEMHPSNEGTWRLDSTGDSASFERTTDLPDLRLDVRELGTIYLGGMFMTDLLGAARVDEVTDGAAARLDAMLRSERAPWTPEVF